MGENLTLTASDGHEFSAYLARPDGTPRGALVVIQEIFGVNGHIRGVADGYAQDGYLTIAPALFDRIRPGIELGYGPAAIEEAIGLKSKVPQEAALRDCAAALAEVASAGKAAVVGYCWGGTLAWAAAVELPGLSAAISYYGAGTPDMANLQPRCPAMFHFGEQDQGIPLERVEVLRAAHPDLPLHIYPADHGFNCEARGSYHPESAAAARARTLAFLERHLTLTPQGRDPA